MGTNYYIYCDGEERHVGKASCIGQGYEFIWAMDPTTFFMLPFSPTKLEILEVLAKATSFDHSIIGEDFS